MPTPHPLPTYTTPTPHPLPTPPQLSITLNNMNHVKTVVKQLPQKLDLQGTLAWMDEQEVGLGTNAKQMVDRLLESADEDYGHKLLQIVHDIARKVGMLNKAS